MRDRLGSLAPHLTNEYEWPELEQRPLTHGQMRALVVLSWVCWFALGGVAGWIVRAVVTR